jgi:hypothetical protein
MVSFAEILVVEREPQTALEVALARLDESWSILADLQIGPKDEIAADYVALHPARGIALIDLASNTRNDPTDCLRRLLGRQNFTARFPGVLPVVRLVAEATDAATIADRLEAVFAEAPAITIAKSGWVNAASDILIGRARGARLPAPAVTERPAHLAQWHENTISPLELDAWKYAPGRRPNDRPGHDTVEREMPRHPASRAWPPGGFIEEPELSPGGARHEPVPGRREIAPARPRRRSSFALLLSVIAGGIMGGGVWLALSGGVGDRFEDASGGVRVALEPPSLALPAPPVAGNAPTPHAATPNASIASPPAPATPTGAPPSVEPLPPEKNPPNGLAAAITTLSGALAVPAGQSAAEHEPPAATVAAVASPALEVEYMPANDSPPVAAATPAATLFPDFEPPARAGAPLETASPATSPPASSQPTIVKRPVGRPAQLAAHPVPEKSAASARRPTRMSEPRSKSAPTKEALLEAPMPKRYDGQPVDAHQLAPSEAAVNPPAPAVASTMPNMHAPTSLLSRPVIAQDLPVVSCRAYTSTHNLLGQLGNARGVACREPEGQWTIVQESFN